MIARFHQGPKHAETYELPESTEQYKVAVLPPGIPLAIDSDDPAMLSYGHVIYRVAYYNGSEGNFYVWDYNREAQEALEYEYRKVFKTLTARQSFAGHLTRCLRGPLGPSSSPNRDLAKLEIILQEIEVLQRRLAACTLPPRKAW